MRKNLRRIDVDGRQFRWVLPGNSVYVGDAHVSVFAAKNLQPLRIDPFPVGFEIRPRSVAEAIRFALAHGWSPDEGGPALYVALRDGQYVVLPPGIRYLHDLRELVP